MLVCNLNKAAFILSLIAVFVLLSPSALAEIGIDFEERDTCKILPYEYEVNITNNRERSDIFRVRVPHEFSTWTSITNSIMRLESGDTGTSVIRVDAPRRVELGEYNMDFRVSTENEPIVSTSESLCFIVLRDYSMHFESFYIERAEYGPEDQVSTFITVENDGTKDFDDGEFYIEIYKDDSLVGSQLSEFDLETGKSKTVEASVDLDEYQSPGEYKVVYEVRGAGHTIESGEAFFDVIEVTDYETYETSDGRYITRTSKIHAENRGNVVEERDIEKSIIFPISLLSTAEDAEVIKEGLSTMYIWTVELEPGQSAQMSYEVTYWPLYVLVVLLLLIVFRIYLYMKTPVVKKEVVESEVSEDKRILTVSLHVKNRIFGTAKNVILEDSAPSVTRVLEDFDTLEPSIERKDDETILRWKLGDLDSGDSRVIHYKVKVLVESIDELIFPEAKVRGAVGSRTFERSSSRVRLGV